DGGPDAAGGHPLPGSVEDEGPGDDAHPPAHYPVQHEGQHRQQQQGRKAQQGQVDGFPLAQPAVHETRLLPPAGRCITRSAVKLTAKVRMNRISPHRNKACQWREPHGTFSPSWAMLAVRVRTEARKSGPVMKPNTSVRGMPVALPVVM